MTVGREADIALQGVGPLFERRDVGGQGVLRPRVAGTPVRDDLGSALRGRGDLRARPSPTADPESLESREMKHRHDTSVT
jgi:hypothetical protein